MTQDSEEYVNFLIPLASQEWVAQKLRRLRRTAVVSPAHAGFVVACDAEAEGGDAFVVDRIAELYAQAFSAPTLIAGCDSQGFFFRLVEGKQGYRHLHLERAFVEHPARRR